mmetsp:Transcript_36748/g.97957  ORF Transcript_36748/g.97957 Transcript_36748/m.97957 type:complete len:107 (-) Transcript_36748:720-1040(-)
MCTQMVREQPNYAGDALPLSCNAREALPHGSEGHLSVQLCDRHALAHDPEPAQGPPSTTPVEGHQGRAESAKRVPTPQGVECTSEQDCPVPTLQPGGERAHISCER